MKKKEKQSLPCYRTPDTRYLSDRSLSSLEAFVDTLVMDGGSLVKAIRLIRNMAFTKAYERSGEMITVAAKQLDISPTALYREFERYGR